jgi:HK97 family phage portal protein
MGVVDRLRALFGARKGSAPQTTNGDAFWRLTLPGFGGVGRHYPMPKPTPRNLRHFARTPYARRAINAIKNPVAGLDFEIVPVKGIVADAALWERAKILTACLARPNPDDSFRSLIEQVLEDTLTGAGALEIQATQDPMRPCLLWPVDGLSIEVDPDWSGEPGSARYRQTNFGIGETVSLRNDQLIYLRANPSTHSPFGLGPLEVAFNSIARQLAVADYAGKLAANARPSVMLNLGAEIGVDQIQAFRAYWRNEVEGQGLMPIIGAGAQAQALRLTPDGDDALYLKYQEWIVREIATCFDLSPQNMGLERDVGRHTAEVAEDRDWDQAIRPFAGLIAAHLNRDLVHGLLGETELEFRWIGLDRGNELALGQTLEIYYKANVMTPNELRAKLGLAKLASPLADLLCAELQMAVTHGHRPAQDGDPGQSASTLRQ